MMVEPSHKELTVKKQCEILGISRSSAYYKPMTNADEHEIKLVIAIREVLMEKPFYGYRKIAIELQHLKVTRKQVRRIMKKAGLRAIYPKKRLSLPGKGHKKYPYLLRDKKIFLPNQVWATDITYIRLSGGFVYLIAIIDLYSRKVLSWSLSNTMDTNFCVACLEDAISMFGVPGIFNTDQGCQFTSKEFTAVLEKHDIQISMDGVGRALDNVFVERMWRSLKYENIYLNAYGSMDELKEGLRRYFDFFNKARFHESLDYLTPDKVYGLRFIEKAAGIAA
jgi:putative transposase